MASRLFGGLIRTFGKQERQVKCKIFPNGASAASFTSQGGVASAVRSSAGKFLITGADGCNFRSLVSFQATYVDEQDNQDLLAQGGAVANLGTSSPFTAVVKLKTGATNTDNAAAGADRYISCELTFEDSA